MPPSHYEPPPSIAPAVPAGSPGSMPRKPRRSSSGVRRSVVVLVALVALLLGFIGGALARPFIFDSPGPATSAGSSSSGAVIPLDGSIAAVAAAAVPSTVYIEAQDSEGISTGTGMVLRSDGFIVTNNHVIADAAADDGEIFVTFADGQVASAAVVGRTSDYDLAVVKVDREDLVPLPLADSDAVVVGEGVVAVGAPLGLEGTVTAGIVSALNRAVTAGFPGDQSFINAIQTDAAINPGNSGGPLLNLAGEVIGINTAIAQPQVAASATGSIGLGFAIPANQVKRTTEQLIEEGVATYPLIGVLLDATYQGRGVKVVEQDQPGNPAVVPDGPGEQAGIERGDIILAVDGRPVTSPDEVIVYIRAHSPGDVLTFAIERDGQELELEVTLGESEAD